ncbi:unnamed protein product [Symbiodinium natans]|uniref:Uncharacterized protein n=1 Tax=Symbiodinium natans TaxID=878477 RepID=A0A812U1L2_9DINO|nr:unnamed protein product [Symbiodinium natans]
MASLVFPVGPRPSVTRDDRARQRGQCSLQSRTLQRGGAGLHGGLRRPCQHGGAATSHALLQQGRRTPPAALALLADLPQEGVGSLIRKAEWRLKRAEELMEIRREHEEARALVPSDAAGALRHSDAARKRAEAAGLADSELAEMQYTSGLALCRMCCFADATGCFERCLKLSPGHAEAATRLAAAQRAMRAGEPTLKASRNPCASPSRSSRTPARPGSMTSAMCERSPSVKMTSCQRSPRKTPPRLARCAWSSTRCWSPSAAGSGTRRCCKPPGWRSTGGGCLRPAEQVFRCSRWGQDLASWVSPRRSSPKQTRCARKLLPEARVVMTDYDPAVLAAIQTNIAANFGEDERKPQTGRLDFRDFDAATLEAAREDPPGGALKELAETKQLGSFHMVLGSDVVYDSYHGRQLALVTSAMLWSPPSDYDGPAPCAVFLLPDSRPRLASFVQALPSAGLSCRIERLETRCAFFRRLRRCHPSLGEDNSYSLYFVERLTADAQTAEKKGAVGVMSHGAQRWLDSGRGLERLVEERLKAQSAAQAAAMRDSETRVTAVSNELTAVSEGHRLQVLKITQAVSELGRDRLGMGVMCCSGWGR